MKKLLRKCEMLTAILVVVILAGILGGCTLPVSKNAGGKTDTSASAKNESKTYKVGEAAKLKSLTLTVNKVYEVTGDEFTKPKEGNKFLAVDCTIENTSKQEQAVSSMLMFKVVDKDGRQCEYALFGQAAAKAGQLDGKIEAGKKLSGVYVVEVPKDKTGLELEFDSTPGPGGQVVVQLD